MTKRIEVHEGPDDEGRYVFTLFWLAGYHPGHPDGEHRIAERGQVFHAQIPAEYERLEADHGEDGAG